MSSTESSGWQPLLKGELRQKAERAIQEIWPALEPTDSNLLEGPDLLAQYALLHAYLAVVTGDDQHEQGDPRIRTLVLLEVRRRRVDAASSLDDRPQQRTGLEVLLSVAEPIDEADIHRLLTRQLR